MEPSVSSVGDSYDNALAETINGLYKAEVIHRRGPWRNFEAVEFATFWIAAAPRSAGMLLTDPIFFELAGGDARELMGRLVSVSRVIGLLLPQFSLSAASSLSLSSVSRRALWSGSKS